MGKLLSIVLAVIFFFHVALADSLVHFYDHKVIRAKIATSEHFTYIVEKDFDVWSNDGVIVMGTNDIMLTIQDIAGLNQLGVNYTVLIDDVEHNLEKERVHLKRSEGAASPFHNSYHSYAEIVDFVRNLTLTYPHLAKFVPVIGKSVEGRDIGAVEITGGKSPVGSLFFSGGQHAREWIASATVVYIIDQLISNYGIDPETTAIVDKFNFYIVPLVNPDGYEFTRASNRLWRKNRRHNSNGSYGVDLNRNWDEHWCQYGSSTSPSSDTYCGTTPFSEPETKATSDYIKLHAHSAVIDFHSYGQLALRPYGWTTAPPPTEALLKSVGDGIVAAIKAITGKIYTSEHGADLYPASGAADDWSFTVAKVPLVYTLELRDTGSYGFQLPASQIIGTGDEAYAAVKYLASRI